MTEPSRIDLLELDIDTRMAHLWVEMPTTWTLELVAMYMRAAYGQGYTDAFVEGVDGDPGMLFVSNGYTPPGCHT